jgi:hypothetical protein
MLYLSSCRSIGNYKMNFNKMGGFFLLGSVLPKGAKNSGWRQSSFDGLKPKIFDMGLAPRFHMSSKVVNRVAWETFTPVASQNCA